MLDSHAHDSYRIEIVCLGNICRSPMAHVVLDDRLSRAGLADRVHVSSSGTGGWHTGDPMDPRAADVLAKNGKVPTDTPPANSPPTHMPRTNCCWPWTTPTAPTWSIRRLHRTTPEK